MTFFVITNEKCIHISINMPGVGSLNSEIDVNNTYNAAGVSRRKDQNVTNLVKNVNILELGYYYLESL